MPGIWTNRGSQWELLESDGFPDEATLQELIAAAPQMLPLAGSPDVAVIGREVQLGRGYIDLLAIERTGRPVLIEVKLGRNSEARRAVVAQILAYASYMHGWPLGQLEQGPLSRVLREHGVTSLYELTRGNEGFEDVEIEQFEDVLRSSLENGHFRLVLVLDEVPPELSSLVAYLESITDGVIFDLAEVNMFDVDGSKVVMPQRIQPQRAARTETERLEKASSDQQGQFWEGSSKEFEESIELAPEENRDFLKRLLAWARGLEAEGMCYLSSYRGKRMFTLLPTLHDERVRLVTLYNDRRSAYLGLQGPVIERRAPHAAEKIRQLIAPIPLRNHTTAPDVSDEFLVAIADAFREAANAPRS